MNMLPTKKNKVRKSVHFQMDDSRCQQRQDEQQQQQQQTEESQYQQQHYHPLHQDVQSTLHLNDYTVDEIHDCWYSACEYKQMRDDKAKMVSQIRDQHHSVPIIQLDIVDRIHCRGLEYSLQRAEIRRRIEDAIDAVMDAQELGGDEEQIKDRYALYTTIAHLQAHMCGVVDHLATSLDNTSDSTITTTIVSSPPPATAVPSKASSPSVFLRKTASSALQALSSRTKKLKRSNSGGTTTTTTTTISRSRKNATI